MVKDLSKLEGKVAVFGGAYSNLHALKALKAKLDYLDIPASNVICTGDVVGYCAFPEESIQFIKSWGIHCITGNVELSLRKGSQDCGCNFNEGGSCDLYSQQWFPYVQSSVSQNSLTFLNTLPEYITFQYNDKKHFVIHGSYFNTSQFIFKSTPWEVKEDNFKATGADVLLSGHCGIPFIDHFNQKTWVNGGVIGMPANDGNVNTWFCILDNGTYVFEELEYGYKEASNSMLKNPLPKAYAETLINGIWDNCDILPEYETHRQGEKLNFTDSVSKENNSLKIKA